MLFQLRSLRNARRRETATIGRARAAERRNSALDWVVTSISLPPCEEFDLFVLQTREDATASLRSNFCLVVVMSAGAAAFGAAWAQLFGRAAAMVQSN